MTTLSTRRPAVRRLAAAWLLWLVGMASAAFAQGDTVAVGRGLYEAAAFEQALATLAPVDTSMALRYRALCLFALGRHGEAEQVVAELVGKEPTFALTEGDLSPRMAALFAAARLRVLPPVLRQLFVDGSDRFRAGATAAAAARFRAVIDLTGESAVLRVDGMRDLRLLAQGYVDLMSAAVAAAAPVPDAVPAAPAVPVATAPPAIAPLPVVALIPPVARSQALPKWTYGKVWEGRTRGAVRVTIGLDGRVSAAVIDRTTDPRYDRQVLLAARRWLYTPAMHSGAPVVVEKLIEYNISDR